MIQISKKGRNFNGDKLSEQNINGNALVVWKKNIYLVGNRRNFLVELLNADGKFIRTVHTEDVKLIACNPN